MSALIENLLLIYSMISVFAFAYFLIGISSLKSWKEIKIINVLIALIMPFAFIIALSTLVIFYVCVIICKGIGFACKFLYKNLSLSSTLGDVLKINNERNSNIKSTDTISSEYYSRLPKLEDLEPLTEDEDTIRYLQYMTIAEYYYLNKGIITQEFYKEKGEI